jgi:amidase
MAASRSIGTATAALAFTATLVAALILFAGAERATAGPAPATTQCPVAVDGLDLTTATIPQLRAALDSGATSTRALVEGYLARIEALNRTGPELRSVIVTAPDALEQADAADAARAAGTARGPLAGIPVLIKDNFDTTDFDTTAGAKAMLGTPPPRDAFVVSRLREAGAILLGKANMAEWATSISPKQPLGFSDVGGLMHNPYTNGDPSGSSGGSAIAAASGLAGSTIGSETAGSIILPSFFNSAVGIKPTRGLVSRGGVIPLLPQNDTGGPIDQNVTDAATMLGLMTGVDPRDPVTAKQVGHAFTDYTQFLDPNALQGARIGIQRSVGEDVYSIPGLDRIKADLETAGADVVQLDDTLKVAGGSPEDFNTSFQAQFRASLNRYLRARGPTSPMGSMADVVAFNRRGGRDAVHYGQELLVDAENLTPADKRRAKSRLARVKTASREAMLAPFRRENLDALVVSLGASSVTNTTAGFPAVTVPAGYLDPDPFGVVFTGRRWSEPDLIGYAYAYERATAAWRSPATINPDFAAACAG